jgi:hypothetical protein
VRDGYSATATNYHNNDELPNQQSTNIGGRRRRGACDEDDDNDNTHNNHDDLIGNEDVNNMSGPSAQHNNQPHKRGRQQRVLEDDGRGARGL